MLGELVQTMAGKGLLTRQRDARTAPLAPNQVLGVVGHQTCLGQAAGTPQARNTASRAVPKRLATIGPKPTSSLPSRNSSFGSPGEARADVSFYCGAPAHSANTLRALSASDAGSLSHASATASMASRTSGCKPEQTSTAVHR